MTNYILRIVKDEWVNMVFDNKVYYTSMRRYWERSNKILFIKKIIDIGDSILGYGIIDDIITLDFMSPKEQDICLRNGWVRKLKFSKMVRFEPPVLIKDTEIARWPQKGALLHGAPISDDQLERIVKLSRVSIVY